MAIKHTESQLRARAMLERALNMFARSERGTFGQRDAIERDLPNAIEAMIEAGIEARLGQQGTPNGGKQWPEVSTKSS